MDDPQAHVEICVSVSDICPIWTQKKLKNLLQIPRTHGGNEMATYEISMNNGKTQLISYAVDASMRKRNRSIIINTFIID